MASCGAAAAGSSAQEADTFVRMKRAQRALEMLDIQVRRSSRALAVGGCTRVRAPRARSTTHAPARSRARRPRPAPPPPRRAT